MAAIAAIYVVVGLALGWAWIATEVRLEPRRRLALDFLIVALGWPLFAVFVLILLLTTKSKKSD